MKLADRMRRSIANRPGTVILRSELADMASPTQLSRILSRFVDEGRLIRVGKGVYVKTRTNRFTGRPSPAGTLESIAAEVFDKLKIQFGQESYSRITMLARLLRSLCGR